MSNATDDFDEDAVAGTDAELIGNNSGKLDRNMANADPKRPRPQDWYIDLSKVSGPTSHKLTANPHHLIPGNESLKEAVELLPWIFSDKGRIENDIGYDVNSAENGIWLPSNNSMRKNANWNDPDFKGEFVVLAMDRAQGHFHDRHLSPYSESVTNILNKIADRLNGVDTGNDCPYQPSKGANEKYKPPYALVDRLNGVSGRLRGHLSARAAPQGSFYTSRLVLWFWMQRDRTLTDAKRFVTDSTGKLKLS